MLQTPTYDRGSIKSICLQLFIVSIALYHYIAVVQYILVLIPVICIVFKVRSFDLYNTL